MDRECKADTYICIMYNILIENDLIDYLIALRNEYCVWNFLPTFWWIFAIKKSVGKHEKCSKYVYLQVALLTGWNFSQCINPRFFLTGRPGLCDILISFAAFFSKRNALKFWRLTAKI